MEQCKRILKRLFFLLPVPTVILALFGYGFVLAVMILPVDVPAVQYLSYVCSAYALIITITSIPRFVAFARAVKEDVNEHSLIKKLRGTEVGERFFSDVRFRTEISLYQGLLINTLYIGMKLFSGIYYRSVWFIALAAYYILLAIMRFILLRKGKKKTQKTQMETELLRYRTCGIILLLMNQALAGIVIFMVHQNRGFDYPGLLIYAMATYSFYAIITAGIKLIRFRKHGSPILSAAKAVNFVAAMVSILSLETAMLAQFEGNNDPFFRKAMTAATGGGVCTIVIGMAVFMIWKSTKQLKNLRLSDSQT